MLLCPVSMKFHSTNHNIFPHLVRVVRFYVSCRSFSSSSPPSPRRRTSTTTIHAQCSLPDLNHDQPRPVFAAGLNHDQPRPVFAAGPQPRPSTSSVRRRTSTTTSHAQCSLPDLNQDHQRPVFAAGPQLLRQKLCQIECQKICQIECQKI